LESKALALGVYYSRLPKLKLWTPKSPIIYDSVLSVYVGSMPPSLRINARNRGIRSPRFILGVGSPKLKFGLLNTLTKVALIC